tara:strand:+ start:216 stop:1274 length:1059 start_codon:yes stop_codon:yes gene_type:complete
MTELSSTDQISLQSAPDTTKQPSKWSQFTFIKNHPGKIATILALACIGTTLGVVCGTHNMCDTGTSNKFKNKTSTNTTATNQSLCAPINAIKSPWHCEIQTYDVQGVGSQSTAAIFYNSIQVFTSTIGSPYTRGSIPSSPTASATSWGSSLVYTPAYHPQIGDYSFAASVTEQLFNVVGDNIEMSFTDIIGTAGMVTYSPPTADTVTIRVNGVLPAIDIKDNNYETLKLGILSSMFINKKTFDVNLIIINNTLFNVSNTPGINQWAAEPSAATFLTYNALSKPTSWAPNPPGKITITCSIDGHPAAWVTGSNDPNDDNLGAWIGLTLTEYQAARSADGTLAYLCTTTYNRRA